MARFMGLSPYSNPIESGVDTFAKLNNVFNQQDQLEIQKKDAEQRQQMNSLTIQEETDAMPAKKAQSEALKLKAEHEIVRPHIASAMVKNEQARQAGTMPEYSGDEIDAIMHLNKEAPLLDNDPNESIKQISALHNIQGTMAQVTPALMQSAQKLPEGQRKVRINDQNAPGLVDNFNVAFKKMLNGKQAESFLIDMDQGTIIPVVRGRGDESNNSDWGKRADGPTKGNGWLGVMTRPDGKISSEISVGVNINGKEVEIPTMVPTLSKEETDYLLSNPTDKKDLFQTPTGKAIMTKAVDFAKDRMAQGKSPFAGNDEGPPHPLTTKGQDGQEYVNSIPIKLMQNYISQGASFGNLLLPAMAQVDSNGKILEDVKKAGTAREAALARSKALDAYSAWADKNPDADVNEQRMQIQKIGSKFNVDEATLDKIAKGVVKEGDKPTGHIVYNPDSPTKYSFLTEQGNMIDGAPDPDAKDARKEAFQALMLDKREAGQDRRTAMREDRIDSRAAKRERAKDVDARKDKAYQSAKDTILKTPEGKAMSADEVDAKAQTMAESYIKGEKPPVAESTKDKTVKALSTWMKGFEKESWYGGTDMEDTIKGAVDKGHSADDLRAAALRMPANASADREKQQQILAAIDKAAPKQTAPARTMSPSSPAPTRKAAAPAAKKEFDDLPDASQFNGKIFRDTKTGIRYKSSNKKWIALPEA